jgi:hypothetical protein
MKFNGWVWRGLAMRHDLLLKGGGGGTVSDHVDQVDAEMAQAMREDVRAKFADAGDGDWVDGLSDEEVVELVDQVSEGGAAGFRDGSTNMRKLARRVGVDHGPTDVDAVEIANGVAVSGVRRR